MRCVTLSLERLGDESAGKWETLGFDGLALPTRLIPSKGYPTYFGPGYGLSLWTKKHKLSIRTHNIPRSNLSASGVSSSSPDTSQVSPSKPRSTGLSNVFDAAMKSGNAVNDFLDAPSSPLPSSPSTTEGEWGGMKIRVDNRVPPGRIGILPFELEDLCDADD